MKREVKEVKHLYEHIYGLKMHASNSTIGINWFPLDKILYVQKMQKRHKDTTRSRGACWVEEEDLRVPPTPLNWTRKTEGIPPPLVLDLTE